MKKFIQFSFILTVLLSTTVIVYAQKARTPSKKVVTKTTSKYYVYPNFSNYYLASHDELPVYSSIGVEKVLSGYVTNMNVYMAENYSQPYNGKYWCKLYTLEGNFLGYIWSTNIVKCKPPVAPQFEMVHVKGASYLMGDNNDSDASPEHTVSVSDFDMCKYEVTPDQWEKIFGGAPMDRISWYDVQNFIKILNRLTHKQYRLPTEAEWEYAAKGGSLGNLYKYSGSNNADEVAWHKGNTTLNNNAKMKAPGMKKPNELGLYDMSGNMWEFCQDTYRKYTNEHQDNPVYNGNAIYCVIRGGGLDDDAEWCSTTKRGKTSKSWTNRRYSFRLVLSSSQNKK